MTYPATDKPYDLEERTFLFATAVRVTAMNMSAADKCARKQLPTVTEL